MRINVKWFLLVALLIPCWVIGINYDIDLVVLHATSQFINNDYTRVYAQNGTLGRYFYGPFSLILIKPLGYFSYVTVKYFWLGLQTLCYFVFWSALTDLYPFLKKEKYFWGWILVWIVSINPIHNNYQSNNIQLMLATLLLLAEKLTLSTSANRQKLGGLLVTIAAGIKVFPGFLIPFYFIVKNNNVRKGVLIGIFAVGLSPFLVLGVPKALFLYQGFFSNLTTYSAENSLTNTNDILCLPSLLARLGLSARVINLGILLLSFTFYSWVFIHRTRFSQNRVNLHVLALVWALSVLLNPSTRPHYFIFYIPAFCSLLEIQYASGMKLNKLFPMGILISTLLIAFTAEGVVGKPTNEWLEAHNWPTIGMLILTIMLALVIGSIRKTHVQPPNAVNCL